MENNNKPWIDLKERQPESEGYYEVKYQNGNIDDKPFRIRPSRNICGFMTTEEVSFWRELSQSQIPELN